MASSKTPSYSSWLLERIATGDAVRLRVGVTSIGRIHAVINISDSHYVSRKHGELRIDDNDVVEIVDLNSVNGTYVNGVQYQGATAVLHANDRIGIGVLDDCEDEPAYPVFRLKYMPLRRASARSNEPGGVASTAAAASSGASSTASSSSSSVVPASSGTTAPLVATAPASKSLASSNVPPTLKSTTGAASSATGAQSAADTNDIITLSDDEDEQIPSKAQSKSVELEVADIASKCVTAEGRSLKTDGIAQAAIAPSSTISSISSTSKIACGSTVPSKQKGLEETSLPAGVTSTNAPLTAKSSLINDDRLVAPAATKAAIHAPNMLKVKEENGIPQEVNTGLNGSRENVRSLRNGDIIDLSSDTDEENDEHIETLGALLTMNEAEQCDEDEQPKSRLQAKSPNIFESSLNSSKETENEDTQRKSLEEIEKRKEDASAAACTTTKRVDSFENDDDCFDMLSQILIDDIKAELASDSEDNGDANDAPVADASDAAEYPAQLLAVKVKTEPMDDVVAQNEAAPLRPVSNDCWTISDDDEDYDEELESKVFDWSAKLLSQKMNMSQAFELDESAGEDEQDDRDNNADADNDIGLQEEYDKDYDDYYNMELDDRNRIVDEVYALLAEKNGEVAVQKTTVSPTDDQCTSKSGDAVKKAEKESLRSVVEKELTDTVYASKSKRRLVGKTRELPQSDEENENEFTTAKEHLPDIVKENNCIDAAQTEKRSKTKPKIIDAPKLPKHKGKLRGVSAEPHSSAAASTIEDARKKAVLLGKKFKDEDYNRELKRKWLEKPVETKRREKEEKKQIQKSRKERLKELADRQTAEVNKETLKRKIAPSDESDKKKAKVKITAVNRGAFLAEEIKQKTPFKIPKIKDVERSKNAATSIAKTDKQIPTKENTTAGKSEVNNSKSKPNDKDYACNAFALEISKADEALLRRQQQQRKGDATQIAMTAGKSADVVRAQRTTNKITFASMNKNYVESRYNQELLKELHCDRSCLTNVETRDANTARVKKKVRFNDTPTVYYIERIYGANKKVDCKDLLPKPLVTTRRRSVRENFPIVDYTGNIISMILAWCNEWLVNRNAQFDAASDVLLPMPTQFTSFSHYKSIVFPLMRLEFVSSLEQEKKRCKIKEFKVVVEQVLPSNERLIVFARCAYRKLADVKSELVILDWGKISVFAYMVNKRVTGTNGHTLVYEIMAEGVSLEKLRSIKDVTVCPIIENLRVELGAFNSVYQLEKSPLLNEIINPHELCKHKAHAKHKICYKGYDKLNPRQLQVLLGTYEKTISGTPNITLIHGPPGTGKSCLISNLVLQLLYGDVERFLDQRVLVCAQSNAAVDVIAAKLYGISQRMRPETMFRLIRYGQMDRINPKVRHATLERIIERGQVRKLQQAYSNLKIPGNTDVKEYLRSEMKQLELVIEALTASNIKNTVQEDELLDKQKQLKQLQHIVNGVLRHEDEHSLYTWHLENANVVCATLSSCVKLSQYVNYFDACIIDEATQCTEPWTLLPLRFGINSLVLVGDTQQLPATVLSKKASDFGLGRSLFTRVQSCIEPVKGAVDVTADAARNNIMYSLQTQYRMHPEICRWPNSYFYKNELINGSVTLQYKTPISPFSVLNLMYSQNDDCMRGQIANEQEARFVVKLVQTLDGYIPNKYNSYGVITPYAQQRATLERAFSDAGLADITVNTIDSYQGTERDVIIISNARTNGVGFLSNHQRLNVALTRPRKCLLLCGNFKSLESVPAWRSLLNSARERNVYHELTANCMDDMHRNVIGKIKMSAKKPDTTSSRAELI